MKKNKLEKLEAIRGFAALYVVLFHLLPQKILLFGVNVGLLFRFGPEAVIVFFVLSGFVIKYSWEKSKDRSFAYYFKRRFIRLYVPLFFIFLMGYLIKCYSEGALANPDWPNLLANIFMFQDVISQKPNVIAAAYMGNGVLWSLSYEWWFYMLFFVLAKNIKSEKLHTYVSILVVVAALSYLIYPFFINRLLMYFAIWWIGVTFADFYLKGNVITLKSIVPYGYILVLITLILGLNLFLNFEYTKVYSYPLVAYPFVELRHFLFAIIVMVGAVFWNRFNWLGFNTFFGVFKHIAPFSYVIYISHHYLVIEASYLSFLNNKILENTLYVILMLLFSYLLEVIFYNKIRKWLI